MATLTIRNLDDEVKRALSKRVAENGVSMEEEARRTLAQGVGEDLATICLRKIPTVEEILALDRKPDKPIDQKRVR